MMQSNIIYNLLELVCEVCFDDVCFEALSNADNVSDSMLFQIIAFSPHGVRPLYCFRKIRNAWRQKIICWNSNQLSVIDVWIATQIIIHFCQKLVW